MPAELARELAPGHQESESDMQGQAHNHENQSSTNGNPFTTATMDDPPQQPAPAIAAAPQIRSRITVVCAECKRLKLKCDRRTPCGSCMKRDTVARCIYSPAAAEKVDLHSLNNRLMQVESILAMVTAGKAPPPFQSTYPLAQVPIPTNSKPRAHLATPPLISSISIRSDDLANIWLAQCQLDLYSSGSHPEQVASDSSYVKLEPSPIDILSTPFHENIIVVDDSLTNTTSSSIHRNLPPIHAYYPSSSTAPPDTALPREQGQSTQYTYRAHNPYLSQFSSPSSPFPPQRDYEFPPSTHTPLPLLTSHSPSKPSVTPALLAVLPPPPVRTKLLSRARAAYPHLALVTHWSRIAELADGGEKTTLARAIFGIDSSSKPSNSESTTSTSQTMTALPLFACLCFVLALGALEPNNDLPADPVFLSALGGQALSVWEQYTAGPKEVGRERSDDGGLGKEVERDKEDVDHLVAGLLQVKYLMCTGHRGSTAALEAIFPLVGKLVNEARGLGFGRDPEEDMNMNSKRSAKSDERRRTIWWDIMFYDAFVSDALCQPPLVPLLSYSTRLPAIAQVPSSSASGTSSRKLRPHGADGGDGTDELEFSVEGGEIEDERDKDAWKPPKMNGLPKARMVSKGALVGKGKGKVKASGSTAMVDDIESGFFGVQCRLTRLMQGIKHRLSLPGCECCTCESGSGYTIDQAVKLEGDIRTWVNDLPQPLKLDSGSSDIRLDAEKSAKHAALATELAILANRMIISVYLPLMRPSVESGLSNYAAVHPWSPASRATLDAAEGVVRASRVLQRLLGGASPAASLTMMEEYYPLDKAVLDAVVVCAHSAFGVSKGLTQGKALTEEVGVGLDVIAALGGGSDEETKKIVASLRRKLEGVGRKTEDNALKRKHDLLEGAHGSSHGEQNTMGGMSVDLGSPYESKVGGGAAATQDGHHATSHQEQPRFTPRPSTPQRPSPTSRAKDSFGKTKDKKSGKKASTAYPTVGIRDRGKEGAPWMLKRTSSTSLKTQSVPEPKVAEPMHAPPSFCENVKDYRTPDASQPPPHTTSAQNTATRAIQQVHGYRSRSSSISQGPHPNQTMQPLDYPMPYRGADEQHPNMHINQRRRFSIHDAGHHHQEPSQVQPFASSPISIYNPSQQVPHAGSFEPPRGYDQHRGSFDQNAASSPYPISTPSMSSASSPYGSTSGPPPTPAYGPGPPVESHRPSPPTFGQPQVANPNSQAYYHISSGFDSSSYDGHAQQMGLAVNMTMDPAMSGQQGVDVSPTPIYDKSQMSMYDLKPLGEFGQQDQQQTIHLYQQSAADGSQRQLSIDACNSQPAWSAHPQYPQQQPPPPVDQYYPNAYYG
ncbi:hypothetical protein Hypma_009400 [Hypsizygus marmoreus]|uniref:Zn(2)-C6 fungal-type domain-containing protein n=1 Tax=Hypsizygus marmoreus TaxID=39966 RepID=A0A369JPI1_HYPMA|nr:hypothetical protein Hypma_009400 [Hypsizygus marmoreus]